jgi:hypothetical protein
MTKINVTDVVTDNNACSTINDMDIDMASDVTDDMASDVSLTTQFWKDPIQSVGLISAQHSLLAKHIELYTQPI